MTTLEAQMERQLLSLTFYERVDNLRSKNDSADGGKTIGNLRDSYQSVTFNSTMPTFSHVETHSVL